MFDVFFRASREANSNLPRPETQMRMDIGLADEPLQTDPHMTRAHTRRPSTVRDNNKTFRTQSNETLRRKTRHHQLCPELSERGPKLHHPCHGASHTLPITPNASTCDFLWPRRATQRFSSGRDWRDLVDAIFSLINTLQAEIS